MILSYAMEKNCVVEALEHQVAQQLSPPKMIYCRSLEALEGRLRQPRHNIKIVFISVSDALEMAQLTNLRSLLMDLKLVLVLPRRDPDTIAWAHTLGPRFIAYADNGFEQVGAVLDKMMLQTNENKVIAFR